MLAFCIMDIQTAAKYMSSGYRIKRSGQDGYIYALHGYLWIVNKSKAHYSMSHQDLLSDDWEIITEGIIKDFPLTYSD